MEIYRQQISRRGFVARVTVLLSFLLIPHYRWLLKNLSKQRIFRMQPVIGVRYSRADWNHMKNSVFISREALVAELPHRGLVFAIEQLPVSLSREELDLLFGGRASLDERHLRDRSALSRISAAVGEKDIILRSA